MSKDRNERRQDEIFRLLHEGKKAYDIEAIFLQRKKHHDEIKASIGIPSENRVCERLAKLPYVREALVITDEIQDQEKRDIKIVLDRDGFHRRFDVALEIPSALLWVQVKSSKAGVNGYKADVIAKFDLYPKELELWMWENRQVVLNGSKSEEHIFQSFETQLRLMNQYWNHRAK